MSIENDLITFRNDVLQIINEVGQDIIYTQKTVVFDDAGQLSSETSQTVNTRIIINSGDEMIRTNSDLGERVEGEQNINIPYLIFEHDGSNFLTDGNSYTPKINDLIQIKSTDIIFKIKRIEAVRVFNGVVDYNCVVRRVTLNTLDY